MLKKLLVEETIACPPQRLWLILTLPAEVRRWFGSGECSFEPRLGGAVRFRWTSASTKGEIVAWAPPTLFGIQFSPGSRVDFWCDPADGGGTRLVVTSSVEQQQDPVAISEMLNTWAICVDRIKQRAEAK